jgi:hypothetical protein
VLLSVVLRQRDAVLGEAARLKTNVASGLRPERKFTGRTSRLSGRAYLAAAGLAVVLIVLPVASAAPGDRFTAAIVPSAVQPPGLGGYTIAITNLPNSSDATAGSITIPTGFAVDAVVSPPQASIVAGPCAGHSWNVTIGLTSLELAAPDPSAVLCDRGVLNVTFTVLVAPGDGRYEWTTALTGASGAFEGDSQPTLTIDGTPPETSIVGSPPAFTDATASFSFSASDGNVGSGVTGYECGLDGGAFGACTSPQGYSGLTTGVHTFEVRAHDAAGNVDLTPAAVTWVVDATPPQTEIDPPLPPSPSTSRSATFTFHGSDGETGISGFQCRLDDGSFASCASPQQYSGLSDGSHTFRVRAVDGVGNVDPTPDSHTWTIDATPPPSPVITSAPANPSGSNAAGFTFSDGDPTASLLCRLDGGSFSDCSSGSASYSQLANGSHTFAVKAVDAAGNASGLASYTWTIDTIHPLVTLTEKPPLLTNQTSVSFGFVSNKPNSTYQCRLDGGAFTACASPKLYSGLGDGSHTFAVRAVSLGNVGLPTTYTWTIDTHAPETTITSGPPATSGSASATFAFTSSEPDSTFVCSLNGAGFTPCTSPKTYAGLGDGAYAFRVEAVDRAGNADASPARYSWKVQGVGPQTVDHTPPGNVRRLRRNIGYGSLRLTWRRPPDSDFDHVTVFLSTKRGTPPRTAVYTGRRTSYRNKRFKNGLYYRYLIVSYDHAENASRGAGASVKPSALLSTPRDGRVVHGPPRLVWKPVRKATFYNVQLYYGGHKVLSAWPTRARLALARKWTYAGRRFRLRQGAYGWYVWPAFGPRAKSRYGQLLGYASFRFR